MKLASVFQMLDIHWFNGNTTERNQQLGDGSRVGESITVSVVASSSSSLPNRPQLSVRAKGINGQEESASPDRKEPFWSLLLVSVVTLLTRIANRFAHRRAGTIAVISSVAGDRGRGSNYVYGSAKALVTAFLSGLRQRLRKSGVGVVTIKPGFVDTPMTAAFPKGPLWASPERVALGIIRALDRHSGTVYLPAFWRPIMLIIRAIPESLFLRLSL